MPLLIQMIARGIIIALTAILTFLGIAPNVDIPTPEEARIQTEERKEIVAKTLQPQNENVRKSFSDIWAENLPDIRGILDNVLDDTSSETTDTTINTVISRGTQSQTTDQQESKTKSAIKDVMVNIVCTSQNGTRISLFTGSGVLISPKGTVLTNAHVAQFFLLQDYAKEDHIDCTLRKENIPTYGYKAELIHMSPTWVKENYDQISVEHPKGTGERDYALLQITANTNSALSLPLAFPFVNTNMQIDSDNIGEIVTAAGYPGTNTGRFDFDSAVQLKTSTTFIREVFTFDRDNSIDIFSTGVNPVAKQGSSGGGIFKNGELIGIITTTAIDSESGGSFINALAISHINNDLQQTSGYTISEFLNTDTVKRIDSFKQFTAPSFANLIGPEFCKSAEIDC